LYLRSLRGGESAVDILAVPKSLGNIDNVNVIAGTALERVKMQQTDEAFVDNSHSIIIITIIIIIIIIAQEKRNVALKRFTTQSRAT